MDTNLYWILGKVLEIFDASENFLSTFLTWFEKLGEEISLDTKFMFMKLRKKILNKWEKN